MINDNKCIPRPKYLILGVCARQPKMCTHTHMDTHTTKDNSNSKNPSRREGNLIYQWEEISIHQTINALTYIHTLYPTRRKGSMLA